MIHNLAMVHNITSIVLNDTQPRNHMVHNLARIVLNDTQRAQNEQKIKITISSKISAIMKILYFYLKDIDTYYHHAKFHVNTWNG